MRNALLAVVERELKRVYGEDGWWRQGIAPRFDKQRQTQLKQIFEDRRKNLLVPLEGDEKEMLDLSDLYKIIEGEWARVFKPLWRRPPLPWLKEILDYRNPLAHPAGKGIDRDMAKRLLQNCRFVLTDVDVVAAEKIRSIEEGLDARAAAAGALRPWHAVATPHEDIREGRLEEAIFAANLWAVVQGIAPEIYLDPEEFFRKTCMTVGLGTVLSRVANALGGGDAGDRIISLQTAFGGGKTHSLVALWHLAKHADQLAKSPHCEELRKVLGDRLPRKAQAVAVFTNETCDPTQGRVTPEGVHTRTLWGELAAQLGGKDLYERIRVNDETQRVPQGLYVDVLRAAAPCLILLDELADYCVGAAAVPVGETTLADQTISFIQQLTEAVHQVPGAVVVATLPASKYEVAQSEKGQEAFVTLERRFQRLGADVKPVADDEIYLVVRARLFESITPPNDTTYPKKVAEAYQGMYASHSGEVPSDAAKTTYREQIERAYPFHPLLIDALYTRWGSHPDFQRTRGVLRLLASVVGDLWQRRHTNPQSQPLIQPCHIAWSIDAMQAALTRFWGPGYQAVAAADVLGDKSNAGGFDEERGGDYRQEGIGRGLAAAILLGSFGGQGGRSGFSAKDLKVACSRPGLNWNYSDSAMYELESRCFYLHTTAAGSLGKRYWFSTKPTLNRLVVRYRQQFSKENFNAEIVAALQEQLHKGGPGTATWRPLVDPGSDLPEQKSLTLVILPPSLAWGNGNGGPEAVKSRVMELSARCGGKDRAFRNTLVFLAPAAAGLGKLRSAWREKQALRAVHSDYGSRLDEEQKAELKKRIEDADQTAVGAFGPAYTVALRMAGQRLEFILLPDSRPSLKDHLSYLWTLLVEDEEWILRRVGGVTLKNAGLVPTDGGLRIKDAIDAFIRFTDKPMIASREAVTSGLVQACLDGLIGIGRGTSPENLQARYCKEQVLLDPNEEGLWIIPPFDREPEPTPVTAGLGEVPTTIEGIARPSPGQPTSSTGEVLASETAEAGRPIRKLRVSGPVGLDSWAEIFRCFINPAARMNLKRLKLGIDFEMETQDGQALDENDPAVKAMKESARQLGLDLDEE